MAAPSRPRRRSSTRKATLDVFGGIASLVDKSLLRQEEGIEGEPRFRMLETVREFGLERLEASGEGSQPSRHAGVLPAIWPNAPVLKSSKPATRPCWMCSTASTTTCGRRSRGRGTRATTTRSCAWPAPSPTSGTTAAISTKGGAGSTRHLQTPPDAASPRPRAWALTCSGMLANVCGETDRAAALLTESFSWWEQSGEAFGYAARAQHAWWGLRQPGAVRRGRDALCAERGLFSGCRYTKTVSPMRAFTSG